MRTAERQDEGGCGGPSSHRQWQDSGRSPSSPPPPPRGASGRRLGERTPVATLLRRGVGLVFYWTIWILMRCCLLLPISNIWRTVERVRQARGPWCLVAAPVGALIALAAAMTIVTCVHGGLAGLGTALFVAMLLHLIWAKDAA